MPSDALELKIQLVPSLDGLEVEGVTSPVGALIYTRDAVAKRRIRIQKNGRDGDWTGATLASAVGKPDQDPTSGTFTVTFGANITGALAYNISAANLATALNALASIISAGGVVVESVGTLYKISFLVNGARSLLVVEGIFLEPPTTPRVVRRLPAGDASNKEVQLFSLSQTPLAFSDNWTLHQGGTATSTQDFAGDFSGPARYTFEYDPAPTGGVLVATCRVKEVTQVVFSGANGGDADTEGCWFTLCDQFGVVGFWFSDGTRTEPPSELTSIVTRQLQKIAVVTGDNTSQVNDAIETILLFYAASFTVTSTPSDVPIIVENVESGERTTPQVDSTGLMAATVQELGFSATAAIKIGSNASDIQNALGGDFSVTVGEDDSLTLIATSNRALPNFTLDYTGVKFPDYFEGSMDFGELPVEWAFEGLASTILYIDCYTEFSLTRASESPDTILFFPSQTFRNLIRAGVNYNAGGISGDPVVTGNTLWVDEIYGTASGVVNRMDRQYLTLLLAKAAATSGDTIIVRPGDYTTDESLAKNGVNWHFEVGATVTMASDDDLGIWDDEGSSMSYAVTGAANFVRTATSGATEDVNTIRVSHASSVVYIQCKDITVDQDSSSDNVGSGVMCAAGYCTVHCRRLFVQGSSINLYGIWWKNGELHVNGEEIICSGVAASYYSEVTATPTGDAFIDFNEYNGTIGTIGSDTSAASWVSGKIVRNTTGTSAIRAAGTERLYLTAQKIFGPVTCIGGMLYVTTDKISAVTNGASGLASLIGVTGGVARIEVKQLDPVTFTAQMIKQTGGTLTMFGGDYVGISGSDGFEITGGTADLRGVVLNTVASATDNPVLKSGGTLILRGCTLVAEGTRDSIEAGTAQNVVAMGSFANKAVDGNVTITVTGGLTVDADVV